MQRTRWTPWLVLFAIAAMLALAACGGDDGGGETSAGGGATAPAEQGASTTPTTQAKGEPIKTMTITSLNSQGPVYPNIAITAKAFEKWVNAHGGIHGRPLAVTVCDERGSPPDAAACARRAVDEKAVAAVGSYTFLANNVVPTLAKNDVAWFGICCPGTEPEWTSKSSFPIGDNPLNSVGMVKRANEDGCKNINAVIIGGAESYLPFMTTAMKAYGKKFGRVVILPPTSQDYSAQVAEATGGDADCLIMLVSETPFVAWNTAYAQSGSKARMYGPQGNLNKVSIKGVEPAVEGAVIAGGYPDISTAPWADYRQALKDANADPDQDYNSLGGLGTWAGYTAFKQIADKMDGPINNATFMDAASKTTNLDLNGMVPVIDFTKEWTDNPPLRRMFNRSVVYSQVKDGKIVPLTTEFDDVSGLALGEKPAQ